MRVPLEPHRGGGVVWYNGHVSANDPKPQNNRVKTEQRRCDACGQLAVCVLLPKGGGQLGALCLFCVGRTFGGMKKDQSW